MLSGLSFDYAVLKDKEELIRSTEELRKDYDETNASVEKLKEVRIQYENLAAEIKKLMDDKLNLEDSITAAKNLLAQVDAQVRRNEVRYQSTLKVVEDKSDGWTFELDVEEKRLIELLAEIGNMYRELRSDLATIE